MGGGTSGVSPPSQTTNFNPWSKQKPYITSGYARAEGLYNQPLTMYPGEMIAPQSQATLDALSQTEGRARAGSDLLRGAQGYQQQVQRGDFLNSNPYLDETYNQAARGVTRNFNESVLPALESRFAAAGRIGSGAYGAGLTRATDSLGTSLKDLATDIYGQNYARERGIQDNATGRAAALADADYGDIARLGDVGAARDVRSQSQLDELVSRYDFAQQEPIDRLNRFLAQIGAPIGGTATAYGNTKRGGDWGQLVLGILGGALG